MSKFKFPGDKNHKFASRSINPGEPIDPKLYKDLGIEKMVDNMKIGLSPLLLNQEPFYPDLVRDFYANLVEDKQIHGFRTTVNNSSFVVSSSKIVAALKLKDKGKLFPSNVNNLPCSELEATKFFKKIYVKKINPTIESSSRANNLVEPAYTLHKIIANNIIPKGGNFDRVTREAIVCLFYIYKSRPFDLPKLIINIMIQVTKDKKPPSILPFGSWITLILKHEKVSLDTRYVHDPLPPLSHRKRENKTSASSFSSTSHDDIMSYLKRIDDKQNKLIRDFQDFAIATKNEFADMRYSFSKMAKHYKYGPGYMKNPTISGNRLSDLKYDDEEGDQDNDKEEGDEEEQEESDDNEEEEEGEDNDDEDGDDEEGEDEEEEDDEEDDEVDDEEEDEGDEEGDEEEDEEKRSKQNEEREPNPPPPKRRTKQTRRNQVGPKRART